MKWLVARRPSAQPSRLTHIPKQQGIFGRFTLTTPCQGARLGRPHDGDPNGAVSAVPAPRTARAAASARSAAPRLLLSARHAASPTLAEALDHPYSLAFVCWALAYLQITRGELSHAVRLLERGVALCREWNLTYSFSAAHGAPRLRLRALGADC